MHTARMGHSAALCETLRLSPVLCEQFEGVPCSIGQRTCNLVVNIFLTSVRGH